MLRLEFNDVGELQAHDGGATVLQERRSDGKWEWPEFTSNGHKMTESLQRVYDQAKARAYQAAVEPLEIKTESTEV